MTGCRKATQHRVDKELPLETGPYYSIFTKVYQSCKSITDDTKPIVLSMVHKNLAWRDSTHLSKRPSFPTCSCPGPRGLGVSAPVTHNILPRPPQNTPEHFWGQKCWCPSHLFISSKCRHPRALSWSPDLKSAPLISLTALLFLGSIYDNYPFICLISTFPTRMRVLRE